MHSAEKLYFQNYQWRQVSSNMLVHTQLFCTLYITTGFCYYTRK